MPSAQDVAEQLSALGSEQTRKTWRRHGIPEPMYGVKYGDLEKLRKQLGRDHALAQALWRTGNHDARVLAAMIADPGAMDAAALRAWQRDIPCGALSDAFVTHVAGPAPAGRALVQEWLDAGDERTRQTGWQMVGRLAKDASDLADELFLPLLARLEREIGGAPNGVRDSMNRTLIAIGARSDALAELATAAARRIGPVEIDHGDTDCKTPEAVAYIAKARAHLAARSAKKPASTKKTGAGESRAKAPASKPRRA